MSTLTRHSPLADATRWLSGALIALVSVAALADPPGRVGRISHASGDVSFQNSANHEPSEAQQNWPITGANVLMTGPSGRAEVQIGSTAVRLDGDSEIEFTRLDDEQVHLRVVAGRAAIRVRHRDQAEDFVVTTTHGRVLLDDVGRYRIDVRGDQSLTAFTVHEGVARFDLPDTSLVVQGGSRVEAWGGQGGSNHQSARAYRDNFDEWSLARDRRTDATRTANYVSPDMTGHDDLDEHGQWRQVEEYGAVWVPHSHAVPVGWAPYRWGRWVWVEPWGWTWVDRAPWGFAPFHYGRWVHHGGAWAWAPGVVVRRPVYAPALVGWVGRPGASVTITSGPAVGWFPLGPREVYYPAHPCTPRYVQHVNVTHVANPAAIAHPAHGRHDPSHRMHYRNADLPHAVTMVPAHVMSRGGGAITPNIAARPDARTLAALPVATAASVHAPSRPQGAMPEHRPGQVWSPHRRGDRPAATVGVAPQNPATPTPQGNGWSRVERREANDQNGSGSGSGGGSVGGPGGRDRRVDPPTPRGYPPVPAGPLGAPGATPGSPVRAAPPVQQQPAPQVQQQPAQQPAPATPPMVREPRRDQGPDRAHGNDRREGPRQEPPRIERPRVEVPRMDPPRAEPPRVEAPRAPQPRVEPPRSEPPRMDRPREPQPERRVQQPAQAPAPMPQMERRPAPAPMPQVERRPAPAPMPAMSAAPAPRAEPARNHGGGHPGNQGQPQQQRRGPNDQKR